MCTVTLSFGLPTLFLQKICGMLIMAMAMETANIAKRLDGEVSIIIPADRARDICESRR